MILFKNYITLDGTPTSDFGLYISGTGTYNAPERDVTVLEIPGRNGNLVYDNGCYRNIDIEYPAFIIKDFDENAAGLRQWLLGHSGNYFRMSDTYHPDEFRMARASGSIEFEIRDLHRSGETTLVFDCKPQRFLTSGETVVSIAASGTVISNPTQFDARPLIRVYGTGTVSVGNSIFTIAAALGAYTDIDSELMEAYYLTASNNQNVIFQNNDFPVLHPGENVITWSGSITRIDITPRWWQL